MNRAGLIMSMAASVLMILNPPQLRAQGPSSWTQLEYTDENRGGFAVDLTGNISYIRHGSVLKGQEDPFGSHYDANGIQTNSLDDIRRKYMAAFDDASDELRFENFADLIMFLRMYDLYYNDRQTNNIKTRTDASGAYYVEKNAIAGEEFENIIPYFTFIHRAASSLEEGGTEQTAVAAAGYVAGWMDYDLQAEQLPMSESVAAHKGVCYHYAKATHDILEQKGIGSRYVLGMTEGALHVWLEVKDETGGLFLIDPATSIRTPADVTVEPGTEDSVMAMLQLSDPLTFYKTHTQIGPGPLLESLCIAEP